MTIEFAMLTGAIVLVSVITGFIVVFKIGLRSEIRTLAGLRDEQSKWANEARERNQESLERIEQSQDRTKEIQQRTEAARARSEELVRRSEAIHDRWEKVLTRMEHLLDRLEKGSDA